MAVEPSPLKVFVGLGGAILAKGVCWATTTTPTILNSITTDGTGIASFTSSLSVLLTGTTYYVRSYATNSAGTGYGNQLSFTTVHETSTLTDNDGNTYNTVKIEINGGWQKT